MVLEYCRTDSSLDKVRDASHTGCEGNKCGWKYVEMCCRSNLVKHRFDKE